MQLKSWDSGNGTVSHKRAHLTYNVLFLELHVDDHKLCKNLTEEMNYTHLLQFLLTEYNSLDRLSRNGGNFK